MDQTTAADLIATVIVTISMFLFMARKEIFLSIYRRCRSKEKAGIVAKSRLHINVINEIFRFMWWHKPKNRYCLFDTPLYPPSTSKLNFEGMPPYLLDFIIINSEDSSLKKFFVPFKVHDPDSWNLEQAAEALEWITAWRLAYIKEEADIRGVLLTEDLGIN